MIIILEDRSGDLNKMLRRQILWKEKFDVVSNVPVRLSLPKFTFQQTLNLKKSLDAIGVKNLFGPTADLSGMADSPRLKLSEAIHKAYIGVDEEGTVAAAATGLDVGVLSSFPSKREVIDFVVDQPFAFVVVEKTAGCILFFGHVRNPLKSK